MVIFIKKIKTKEGINSLNLDKVKKDVPADFQVLDGDPVVSFTANHVIIGYKCKLKTITKPAAQPKKAPAKKKAVAEKQ